MAMDLATLLNDYNGAMLLEPGTAEWGYVDVQWYLALPGGHNIAASGAHVIGTSALGVNLNDENFIKANYKRLVQPNALGNPDKALFATLLRRHLAVLGCVDDDTGRRGVIENEYSALAHTGANWAANENDVPANANSTAIAKYVKKFGDTFIQILVYVFLARGHHWQDEYDALYDKLMIACGIPRPTTWTLPTNREIFRQIIHCFGVRILLEAVRHCMANNRMSNPMRLRFTPHAPVAGAAQITTLNAVLKEMESEAWWGTFYAKFQLKVDVIRQEVAAISVHPYEYHVASRVVTGQIKRDLSANSVNAFKSLVQLALGYIDHLGRRHSLFNQKVLTQKSGGNKPLADAFSRACDTLGKPDVAVDSMAIFINAL